MKHIIKLWLISTIMLCPSGIYSAAQEDVKSEQAVVDDSAGTIDIFDAVRQRNIPAVQYWLDLDQEGRMINDYGGKLNAPPLKYAVIPGDLNMVQYLVDKGADLNAPSGSKGHTPLITAVLLDHFPIVQYLVARGADLDAYDIHSRTALSYAVLTGHFDIAHYLRERGASTSYLYSVLRDAVREKNFGIINYMIKDNAGAIDESWVQKAVEEGVLFDVLEVVHYLLHVVPNNRALIDKAWHVATSQAAFSTLEYLWQIDESGVDNALIKASDAGKLEVVIYLIHQKGAHINAVNEKGDTALSSAARRGHLPVVMFLLKEGAAINNPYNLFYQAAKKKDSALMSLLLEKGLNIDALHDSGDSALTAFVKQHNYQAVDFLIKEGGANPYQRDGFGLNAFEYAIDDSRMLTILATTKYEEPSPEEEQKSRQGEKKPGSDTGSMIRRMQHIKRAMKVERPELEEQKEAGANVPPFKEGYPTQTGAHYQLFHKDIVKKFGDVMADPFVQKILKQENIASQMSRYVFYTAQPGAFRVYQYFIESVYRLINLYSKQTPFVWNRFFKDAAQEKTIYEYIAKHPGSQVSAVTPELNVVLSTNIALFGNIHLLSSCTWDFFNKNHQASNAPMALLFKRIFDTYGFDEKYKEELLKIDQGSLAESATLQQIIISKEIVDNIAMISDIGYAVPWSTMIDPSSWDPELNRHTKISSILDKYKTGEIEIEDRWQARILMNALYGLNPESIEINSYVRLPEAVLSSLKKKVDEIVTQMFKEWLEKKFFNEQVSPNEPGETIDQVLSHIGKGNQGRRAGVKKSKEIISLQEHRPATVWKKYAHNNSVDKKTLVSLFMEDCARDIDLNQPIPPKNSAITRVATYNVHLWSDPAGTRSEQQILEVIRLIDADILVLQEANFSDEPRATSIKTTFEQMGYIHQIIMPMTISLNNVILSKYPIVGEPIKKVYDIDNDLSEKRNFINVVIELPNKTHLSLYGTHLDVSDESGNRRNQEVKELVAAAQADPHGNVLLVADWNAVRERDYQYEVEGRQVWDLLTERFTKKTNLSKVPTQTLDYIEKNDFKDCFSRGGFVGPRYTVWTGTVVDFIFCSLSWSLPIVGCYIYYDAASDHLPVLMDIALVGQKGGEEQKEQASTRSQPFKKPWQKQEEAR